MSSQSRKVESQADNKSQHKVKPPVTSEQGGAADLAVAPFLPFQGGSLESQVAMLEELPSAQRQAVIQRISQVQGHRHVQRVVAALQGGSGGHAKTATTPAPGLQTSLEVGEPDDEYEREADEVAETVMRMSDAPSPPPSDEDGNGGGSSPRASAVPFEEIQASGGGAAPVTPEVETRINDMRGTGTPLPDSERTFFENRFGADFGSVRVHTSDAAAQTAQDLDARAYTVGSDIAFNAGEYQPGSEHGRSLLAHELTHVVQQGGAGELSRRPRWQAKANRCIDADCRADAALVKADVQRQPAENTGRAEANTQLWRKANRCTGPDCLAVQTLLKSTAHQDRMVRRALKSVDQTEVPLDDKEPRPVDEAMSPEGAPVEAAGPTGEMPASGGVAEGAPGVQEPASPDVQKGKEEIKTTRAEDVAGSQASPIAETTEAASGGAKEETAAQAQETLAAAQQAREEKQGQQESPPEALALKDMVAGVDTGLPSEMEGAVSEGQAQRDDASARAEEATAALQETEAGTADLAASEIVFAEPEEATPSSEAAPIMRSPEGGTEDHAALLEQHRAEAASLTSAFMSNAAGRVQAVTTIGSAATPRVQGAAEAAKASVTATVQTQTATLQEYLAQARATTQTQAEATQSEILAQHESTVAATQELTAAAREKVETEYAASVETVSQLESDELTRLDTTYADADRKYRQAGVTVGEEATRAGEAKAQHYLSQKINRMDSLLDGYLTDRKCEARAGAAREVAGQYKSGLIDSANEQAGEAMKGKPADQETIRTTGDQIRETLESQRQAALDNLQAGEEQSIAQAEETRAQLLTSVEDTLTAILATIDQQEAAQVQQLAAVGEQYVAAIDQAATETIAQLQTGANAAASSLQGAISSVQGALSGTQVPEPGSLAGALGSAMGQIDGGVAQVQGTLDQAVASAEQSLLQQSTQATEALAAMSTDAMAEVDVLVESMTASFADLAQGAADTYAGIQQQHATSTEGLITAVTDSFAQIIEGARKAFEQLGTNVEKSLQEGEQRLLEGLRGAVTNDMPGDIEKAAEEAAAKEQPAWKGILKIVLIIAIVVVVALVIGPAVIGAVGAAAAALGASAGAASAIGAIVGGAIVGAMTAAAIQMTSNVIDGKNIMEGVGQAALMGAIGGALGGAVGLAVGNLASSLGSKVVSAVGKKAIEFGLNLVADVVVDVGLEMLITGEFSWVALATAVVSSLVMSGAGELSFVKNIQSRSMDLGAGAFGGPPKPRVDIEVDPETGRPVIDEDAARAHAVSEAEDGTLVLDDGTVVQCAGGCKIVDTAGQHSAVPGSPEHKEMRWKEYQERGGTWDYDRWSKTYDQNMVRATEAHKAADSYHSELGWGEREVTIPVSVDGEVVPRRLDIADVAASQGVEYKTGYQCANQDNLWELKRDAILVEQGWDIEWVFEGKASQPLKDALSAAGIRFREL
jgi:hypothetical protein